MEAKAVEREVWFGVMGVECQCPVRGCKFLNLMLVGEDLS